MGTSERSQPTLFDLGESEPWEPTAYATPQHHDAAPGDPKRVRRFGTKHGGRNLNDEIAANLSPSSPAATPASPSHTPGSDWARRMTAISGRRCAGYSTLRGPVGCSLKTLLGTSRWASTLFWLSWKRTATPAGRSLYRLVPSTPSTGATASGSWPTPLAGNKGSEGGNNGGMPLRNAVEAWPTPDKGMADGGRSLPEGTTPTGITPDGKKRQVGLTNAVKAQPVGPWPTPKAKEDGRTPEAWERARQRHYETRKEKGTSSGGPAGANGSLAVTVRRIEEEPKGKLSAAWTLRLMGFPSDWCDDLPPDPLGTTPT